MREHRYVRHKTSTSLVKASQVKNKARKLKAVQDHGMWAFVSVDEDPDGICIVNYWHRADKDPKQVTLMLAHELGHIADGGPKDDDIGESAEEDRADEFARAAWEAVSIMVECGLLVDGRAIAKAMRQSGLPALRPANRSRITNDGERSRRKSNKRAPLARRVKTR